MSRYPYTYAADYLRIKMDPTTVSRSDMAHIQQIIADALGIKKEIISNALADLYLKEYSQ